MRVSPKRGVTVELQRSRANSADLTSEDVF